MAEEPTSLEKEVQNDPKMRRFYDLAREYQRKGRFDEALGLCKKGLELNPTQWQARVLVARIQVAKGALGDAVEQVEKVLRALPENIPANHLAADIYYGQGNMEPALKHYRIVQLFEPGLGQVDERVAELEAGAATRKSPAKHVEGTAVKGKAASEPDTVEVKQPAVSSSSGTVSFDAGGETSLENEGENEKEARETIEGSDVWDEPGDEVENWSDTADEDVPGFQPTEDEVAAGDDTAEVFTLSSAEDANPIEGEFPVDDSASSSVPGKEDSAFDTTTLAELYESQGYPEKAVEVYQRMLLVSPDEQTVKDKIEALRIRISGEAPESPAVQEEDVKRALRKKRIHLLERWLRNVREASNV